MKKEFIAYEGSVFTIEWYFTNRGKSEALEYFEQLPVDRQKKVFRLLKLMANVGKIFNKEKFRSEDDQIYVFKADSDRFLCFFFTRGKIIITNAYEKKADKMPPREKETALKAKADYIKRCNGGTYYD